MPEPHCENCMRFPFSSSKNMKTTFAVAVFSLGVVAPPAQAQSFNGWVKTISIDPALAHASSAFAYPPASNEISATPAVSQAAPFTVNDAVITVPESYGSLLEQDVRRAVLKALPVKQSNEGDNSTTESQRNMTLSFDVNVGAEYRRDRWRSPVHIVYADTARNQRHYLHERGPLWAWSDVEIGIDGGINDIKGSPRLTVRMFLEENDERIWAGYAGAPVAGTSRSQIARALSEELVKRIGETTNDEKVQLEPVGAPSVTIINAPPSLPSQ